MFDDKQKIMERVASLPKGTASPSGRYWCVTCKMLFSLDEPVCPYMPKMCINTPIPVELLPVESAISLEKFGLFYPKVPQKLMAHLADTDEPIDAAALVGAYLSFLADWGIRPAEEPLQTLKSFIIVLSGCETAQRVNEEAITFIVTDHVSFLDGDAGGEAPCPFVEADACAVAWHGGVSPCPPLLHTYPCYVRGRRKLMTRWQVGSLTEQSLAEVWAAPEYVAFRDRVRSFDFPPCTDCDCELAEGNEEDCFGNPHPVCGDCLWARGVVRCP